jgi:hypothetical protein
MTSAITLVPYRQRGLVFTFSAVQPRCMLSPLQFIFQTFGLLAGTHPLPHFVNGHFRLHAPCRSCSSAPKDCSSRPLMAEILPEACAESADQNVTGAARRIRSRCSPQGRTIVN